MVSELKNSESNIDETATADAGREETSDPAVSDVGESKWGEIPEDNFGYASDEERRAKRGLEDWELVDKIPESQEPVPRWFFGIIVAVLLVAVGLSFPFWGDRPGYEREWINWGFGAALLYLVVFGTFVYFMVNFYGSKVAGRLDSDQQSEQQQQDETAAASADDGLSKKQQRESADDSVPK